VLSPDADAQDDAAARDSIDIGNLLGHDGRRIERE
jgi:hypothetical protein